MLRVTRRLPFTSDRGSVLLAALGGVVALSAVALAIAALATVETGIADAERAHVAVLTTAEAALEAAVAGLGGEDDWSLVLAEARRSPVLEPRPAPWIAGWGLVDSVECTRALQRLSDAHGVWGVNRAVWRLFVDGAPGELAPLPPPRSATYAIVWLADDEADGDGAPLQDSNGIVTLRAEAFGSGRAFAAVLATVRRRPAGVEIVVWRAAAPWS